MLISTKNQSIAIVFQTKLSYYLKYYETKIGLYIKDFPSINFQCIDEKN